MGKSLGLKKKKPFFVCFTNFNANFGSARTPWTQLPAPEEEMGGSQLGDSDSSPGNIRAEGFKSCKSGC